MSHLRHEIRPLLLLLAGLLTSCDQPPSGIGDDAAQDAAHDGAAASPDAGSIADAAADAFTNRWWTLEREADDRAIRSLALRASPTGEGGVLAVGGAALAVVRTASGQWRDLSPSALAAVLAPIVGPHGDFQDAAYLVSRQAWVVAGGLGFSHGGIVTIPEDESEGWQIELDEYRDLGGVVGNSVTSIFVRDNCAFCATEIFALFGGPLVARSLTTIDPWRQVTAGTGAWIKVVAQEPQSFGALQGYGDAIYRLDQGWQLETELPLETDALQDAWASDEAVVAVGYEGLIAVNGVFSRHGSANWAAVHGSSATDVWAVGDAGAIVHYDGVSWTFVAPPTEAQSFTAVAVTAGDVWMGTADGAIWRLAR